MLAAAAAALSVRSKARAEPQKPLPRWIGHF
jgi:hypothetical protein